MAVRSSGLTERDREWKGHLEAVASRGVTAKAYAREQGLSYHALYQAKKRLRKLGAWPVAEKSQKQTLVSFARVAVAEKSVPTPAGTCRLRLAEGVTLEWEVTPSAEVLGSVIERVLRR
jgi:hypothetical protein